MCVISMLFFVTFCYCIFYFQTPENTTFMVIEHIFHSGLDGTMILLSRLLLLSLYGAQGCQAALHYANLSPTLCAEALIGLTWTLSLC